MTRFLLALFAVLLASGVLTLLSIGFDQIGLDEPFSIYNAQFSVAEIISNLKGGNNPPLYEILLHFWIKLFGISPIAVRLPSILLSFLTIYIAYRLSDELVNYKAALFTAVLLVLSNYFNWFAHEARVYSLFTFLTILNTYLIFKLRNDVSFWLWLCILFTSSLLLYSHYLGVYVFLMQSFLGSILVFKSTNFKKYFLVVFLAFITFLPYFIQFLKQLKLTYREKMWAATVENLGQFHDVIYLLVNKNVFAYTVIVLVFYSLVIKALFNSSELISWFKWMIVLTMAILCLASLSVFIPMPVVWRLTETHFFTLLFFTVWTAVLSILLFKLKSLTKEAYLTIFVVGTLFIFFLISVELTIYVDRYLLFVVPFFYILLSFVLFKKDNKYNILFGLVIISLMVLSFSGKKNNHEEIKEVVSFIKSEKKDSTAIYIWPKYYDLNFTYHYNQDVFKNVSNFEEAIRKEHVYSIWNPFEADHFFTQEYSSILFLNANSALHSNDVLNHLKRNYNTVLLHSYKPNMEVYLITRR